MTETVAAPTPPEDVKQPLTPKLLQIMGPGLITGASDDDPSGIATYSQAGAQFGYGLGWVLVLAFPLMCAIQEISARIGRVTGRGVAGVIKAATTRRRCFTCSSASWWWPTSSTSAPTSARWGRRCSF